MTIKELRQKRAALAAEARKYHEDNRSSWNGDNQAAFAKMTEDIRSYGEQIANLEQLAEMDRIDADERQSEGRSVVVPPTAGGAEVRAVARPEYRAAYEVYIRTGNATDVRSMNTLVDPSGGIFVPTTLNQQIIDRKAVFCPYREIATTFSTDSDREIPVDDDTVAASWTGEEKVIAESNETVSKTRLGAHKLTKLVKVSNELLQDSTFDIFAFLSGRFGKAYGLAEEPAFTTGDGIGKPRGWLGLADVGRTTDANNAFTSDDLIRLKYSLKAPYRGNATWVMSDNHLIDILLMVDGVGQYIWRPGLTEGAPDVLLGRPIKTCASCPDVAAGTKILGFGDFSYYWIGDRSVPTMKRLNELYAVNDQTGFLMTARMDGNLTLSEAIKVLQIAA